jgi:hypothetical protein
MPPQKPALKPTHIALICVLAVAAMFAGSILISIAVVQAGKAPAEVTGDGGQ